jgi:hypothetical protein
MARTTINSLGVPAGTIVASDLTYPLTTFSSTGIDDNADATAITIDSSENVGIGITSSIAAELHVKGTSTVAKFEGTGGSGFISIADSDDGTIGFIGVDAGKLKFQTSGSSYSDKLVIDTTGKIGIGTTSPGALLHINGSGDAVRVTSTNSGAGGAQVDLLHFSASPADGDDHASINFGGYYSGSTSVYGSAIRSNWTDVSQRESNLKFFVRNGSTFYNHMQLNHFGHLIVGREDNSSHSSRMKIVNGGGSGYEASLDFCYEGKDTVRAKLNTDASGGALEFHTFDSDGLQERMLLNYNGKLGIGTSSPTTALHAESSAEENKRAIRVSYNSSYYGEMVQQGAAGTLFRQYGGANFKWNSGGTDYMLLATNNLHVAGSVTANSSSVSDERFKDNIQTVTGALDKVKGLRGVTYKWNKGSRKDQIDYGVIAQEVETVMPEIVHDMTMPLLTNDEETVYKTVDYSRFSAVLINAIKELEARLATLETK